MIKRCLFPVAGFGTRFLPATKAIPKEMLPILTKPLIQYGVEEAMNTGIRDIFMVVSQHKEAIKAHFKPHPEIENAVQGTTKSCLLDEVNATIDHCCFHYIQQVQMLGLGHAIGCAQDFMQNEAFAVILPDDLCDTNGRSVLAQMSEIHEKYPDCCVVAIEKVAMNRVDKYGVIAGDLLSEHVYRVNNMIEKPTPSEAPSNLAVIGRYILTPEIFTVLKQIKADKNGEIQITDALMELAKKGKVIAYEFAGKRFDCGNVEGYVEANNHFAKKYLFND
jgi:UTP--glucose-1-phosphate uridylyltransferase